MTDAAGNIGRQGRGLVIYQVFTRNHRAGTFASLEEDLPRIRALGADVVYLLPVQPNGRMRRKGSLGSPYAIADYRAVDLRQGTMEEFVHMTQAAHELGLRVMLDVVYNHTAPDARLAAEHPEWYYRRPDGSFGNRIGDWWDVIDLDYAHPELWDYQIDTLKWWAQYVDGFRCDVAPLVPLAFWERARREVETVRPGCLWLAESVEHEFIRSCRAGGVPMLSDGELYRAFDICYDYDLYGAQARAMRDPAQLPAYLSGLMEQEAVFPADYVKLRCLENHDRPRAAQVLCGTGAEAGGPDGPDGPDGPAADHLDGRKAVRPEEPDGRALARLRSWTAWIYFVRGATMIYDGQEYGAVHQPTLFDPDPIAQGPVTADLSDYLARLSRVRHQELLASGSFSAEAAGERGDVIRARYRAIPKTASARTLQAQEPEAAWDAAQEVAGDSQAVGIFPLTGEARRVETGLSDGTYSDAVTGRAVRVQDGCLVTDGDPVILFA